MISIIIWNCVGFSFVDFTIPFIAVETLSVTGIEMGLIYAVNTIGGLISLPIAGWMTDHFARRKIVFLGSLGRGLSYFLIFAAIIFKSLFVIELGYGLLGFGVSFFWVPLYALIAEKTAVSHRSQAYGQMQLSQGKGILIGSSIGMVLFILGNNYAPANVWFVYGAIPMFGIANFVAGFLFNWKVDETIKYISPEPLIPQSGSSNGHQEAVLPFLVLILFLTALFLNALNASLAKPFLQFYLLSTVTNNPNIVVAIYLPPNIFALLLAPYLGRLADHLNPYIGLSITAVLDALGIFLLINTYNPFLFGLILTINFTMSISQGLIMQNFLSRVTKQRRGRIFGLQSLFTGIGSVIGPILGGIVLDEYGLKMPFIISIIVEIALIPVILLAIQAVKPHLAEKFK